MTHTFSLSLKRNRSSPPSKLNAMLNKLTSSFHTNKKRRHTDNRRSSFSILIDYFRTEEPNVFKNDALFEHNRYQQQKKETQCILTQTNNGSILMNHSNHNNNTNYNSHPGSILMNSNNNTTTTTKSILMNNNTTTKSILLNTNNKKIHHRHTNSTPVIPTNYRKKAQHIRHYSHVSCISSSNITVNSEDLTAKEFADMAGIRILSENEEVTQEQHDCEQEKICTFCGDDDSRLPSLIVTSRISNNSSMIRSSSIYSNEEEEEKSSIEPQIWDNQFWTRPGQQYCLMPPILHELKNNQDTFLKKGRFEIYLSSSTHTTTSSSLPLTTPVYEWKRKARQQN